jgi:hypothetical protein
MAWGSWSAWTEQETRTLPLDLDGWGHRVQKMQVEGPNLSALFCEPSLWKGPVVPFVFGASYYIASFPESVLYFNAAAFGVAAALTFSAFRLLGCGTCLGVFAVLAWVFYWPHRMVFGYYYAEPLLALLSALVLFFLAKSFLSRSYLTVAAAGLSSGLLVLARAPFMLVVALIPLLLWGHLGPAGMRYIGIFILGFLIAFLPWPIRNVAVYGELIPFTTEGGKILFQGSYLPGDDGVMNEVRRLDEFTRLERAEKGMSDLEQQRYWQQLALKQISQDPLGQLRLCLKKAMRFWVYVPLYSWIPTWKSAVLACVSLPLALLGFISYRRWPLAQVCAVWVTGLWLFHSLVHAELRYNFPVLPMLFVLTGLGVQSLWPQRSPESLSMTSQPVPGS